MSLCRHCPDRACSPHRHLGQAISATASSSNNTQRNDLARIVAGIEQRS